MIKSKGVLEQGGDLIFTLKQICGKSPEKKAVYVCFIDLEKGYSRVNRKALWQVLRMYNVGSKLLSGIKIMYVDSLACVGIKGAKVSSLG